MEISLSESDSEPGVKQHQPRSTRNGSSRRSSPAAPSSSRSAAKRKAASPVRLGLDGSSSVVVDFPAGAGQTRPNSPAAAPTISITLPKKQKKTTTTTTTKTQTHTRASG
jgi:hypothetical protein